MRTALLLNGEKTGRALRVETHQYDKNWFAKLSGSR